MSNEHEATTPFEQALQRLRRVKELIDDGTLGSEDFAIVGGFKKPSLLKPGAQKLAAIFDLAPHVREILRNVHTVGDREVLSYQLIVTLRNKQTGVIEAEGVGSCNSAERRHAKSPVAEIDNTLLKMAEKRALVDAVLNATGSCSIFTQDGDEVTPSNDNGNGYHKPEPAPRPAPTGDVPQCPKCNSDMWDNRTSKRNPQAPDFKCKIKECDGAIWANSRNGNGNARTVKVPATPEQVKHGNEVRELAIAIGYRTPQGAEPKELTVDMPGNVVTERTAKWNAYIEQQEELDRVAAPE